MRPFLNDEDEPGCSQQANKNASKNIESISAE
jgi:hypothetical protein